jgi:hypothetical protein
MFMPRYYLHIVRDEDVIVDFEGYDLPDLESARSEAIGGARGILSEEVLNGTLSLAERIDIADADGVVLASIPFLATIDIRLPPRDNRDG